MKKSYVIAVLSSMLVMAACGGSGSSTAVQLANNAIAALDIITANWTLSGNKCICG